MNNPFALFDLCVDFNLDLSQLTDRYLNLQKSLHPDNFADSTPQEQRLSMQKSAEINDAFQCLKDPIRRAEAIIQLGLGENLCEQKTNQDITFLMQQMQWREQLEHIEHKKDVAQLVAFCKAVESENYEILSQLTTALSAKNWTEAQKLTDRLRFIKKLFVEIERIEDKLIDL
ncbi:Fe-S protein assembly co-chaperone HscB [Seminibacterium arietis]|uniref:Co-chaperone protein HscB homolog n=1 Tax=Seminibacterium arietis TaxID=1173502 RepID=A0ABW3I8V8_9PAST